MDEDAIKTMVREFRASVSADLESQGRTLVELKDEMRERIGVAEGAIVREIRDLAGRLERRLERLERRVEELGA